MGLANHTLFIAQDEYLNGRRGQYAEKYGALSPWYSHWDMRILQDRAVDSDPRFRLGMNVDICHRIEFLVKFDARARRQRHRDRPHLTTRSLPADFDHLIIR